MCVLRGDQPFEAIVRRAPLLCVEILSPSDTASEMLERVEDYRSMGVGTVWVIDPRRRTASVGSADGVMRPAKMELAVAGASIRLTLREMFAQLDRLEGVAPRES